MNGLRLLGGLTAAIGTQAAFVGNHGGSGVQSAYTGGRSFGGIHGSQPTPCLANYNGLKNGMLEMRGASMRSDVKAASLVALKLQSDDSDGVDDLETRLDDTEGQNHQATTLARKLASTEAFLVEMRDTQHWVKANRKFDQCDVLKSINKSVRLLSQIESTLQRGQKTGRSAEAMQKIQKLVSGYEVTLGLSDLKGEFYARGKPFNAIAAETLYGDKLITEFAESTIKLGTPPCATRQKMNAQRYAEILGFSALKKMSVYMNTLCA